MEGLGCDSPLNDKRDEMVAPYHQGSDQGINSIILLQFAHIENISSEDFSGFRHDLLDVYCFTRVSKLHQMYCLITKHYGGPQNWVKAQK